MSPSALSALEHIETALCSVKRMYAVGQATVKVHGRSRHWSLDCTNPESIQPIVRELPKGVTRLWAPIPTHATGHVAPTQAFSAECTIADVRVMGKVHADGCVIPKGDAFAVLSADCHTLVAYDTDNTVLIAAHAARDSVLDRKLIENRLGSRTPPGIVDAVMDEMRERNISPEDVHMHLVCGIRSGFSHLPHHRKYGAYNRALIAFARQFDAVVDEEDGAIDMVQLITGYAHSSYGVPRRNVSCDGIDTATDTDDNGKPLWASHRHGAPGERNLVIVHHRS